MPPVTNEKRWAEQKAKDALLAVRQAVEEGSLPLAELEAVTGALLQQGSQSQRYGDGILSGCQGMGAVLNASCNNSVGGLLQQIQRQPGLKLDMGKPEVYTGVLQSFPLALKEIARVTVEGISQPGHVLHGWKEVPEGFKRYSEAMGRHLLHEGVVDHPDEFMFNVATTCWNDLARLEHLLQDRAKAEG